MRLAQGKRVPLVAIILAASLAACAGPATPATANGPQDKTKAAQPQTPEATADLAMKRFYETLDFENVWKEMYVSNQAFRDLEVEAIIFKYLDYETKEPIDLRAKERAYVALHNFGMLLSAAGLTNNPEDLSGKLAEMKEPYEAWSRRGRPIATTAELDRDFTGALNKVNDILRKHVVRERFDTPGYREREAKYPEDTPAIPERIREVFAPAGLRPETKIHVVSRELFHFYIIEEQGAFRILTITHRRRF